jgi:hypothetical protein
VVVMVPYSLLCGVRHGRSAVGGVAGAVLGTPDLVDDGDIRTSRAIGRGMGRYRTGDRCAPALRLVLRCKLNHIDAWFTR